MAANISRGGCVKDAEIGRRRVRTSQSKWECAYVRNPPAPYYTTTQHTTVAGRLVIDIARSVCCMSRKPSVCLILLASYCNRCLYRNPAQQGNNRVVSFLGTPLLLLHHSSSL